MINLREVVDVRVNEIFEKIVAHRSELKEWEIRTAKHHGPGDYTPVTDWHPLKVGEVWGYPGITVFFRRNAVVPKEWARLRVGLQFETGGEGLLSLSGEPYHGIDDNRTYVLLASEAEGGEAYDFDIEMKTGGYGTWSDENLDPSERPFLFRGARLVAIRREVEEAYLDFRVTYESARTVKDATLRDAILQAMHETFFTIDFRNKNSQEWVDQLTAARAILRAKLDAIQFGDSPAKAFFTGHSHIDVAWLWPYRETMRKVGRTYASMTTLMDEFPDFHFNCSQVPLYIYTKKYFPTVYEKLKKYVKEGRFEPIGGTWVEHDTNLISGESLVRQCLYGQRFFRNELGVNVRVGWLPDVFGYTWAMPQIYKKSGLDYFMTSKISWNDTNKFPFGTFWWEGIDGSRIFTHFIVGTYNANCSPQETMGLWDAYPSKLDNPEYLISYGHGDGGGGPTREMIESVSRMANIPGMPKASTGRVHDFFDRIAEDAKDLPVWNGEFYFELHRGTLTSQSRNKRFNRKSELLFRNAEFAGCAAAAAGRAYPQEKLVEGWETILLNQFHDVIPGSSIRAVYQDSDVMYAELLESGETELNGALKAVAAKAATSGDGVAVVVFNSLSWKRTSVATAKVAGLDGEIRAVGPDGSVTPGFAKDGEASFLAKSVPSLGYAVYHLLPGIKTESVPFTVEGLKISTPYYDLELGEDGSLLRIYDKANVREVLPEGARGNVLQFFEDKPHNWEAWDVEPQYQEKVWEATPTEPVKVVEKNALSLTLAVKLTYGGSTLDQTIVLYANTPRIDFIHSVDWHERQTLLKVAFPAEIRSSRATYEIAYGAIERPTHWNTSWDWAKFEVNGHKWADLSETGYGVSVLNDCKYGWDIREKTIRLSLLRSPLSPDPEADQGAHRFTYSLFPHAGDWKDGTVQEAYDLNVPLLTVVEDAHAGEWGVSHSFVSIDKANVIVDAVKKAEDSDDLIVRAYEAYGGRGPATLTFDAPISAAFECDLLEEGDVPAKVDGASLSFEIKPFEVKTFKVKF